MIESQLGDDFGYFLIMLAIILFALVYSGMLDIIVRGHP
jgi:hypothetical protein